MSITIEKLSQYVIKKPFMSYGLNINNKFQQSISDNNCQTQNSSKLLDLIKNIKKISNNEEKDYDNSSISSISSIGSLSSTKSTKSKKKPFIKKDWDNINGYEKIQKIDIKLSNVLDKEKYFIYVPAKKDSFIGSILSIIDLSYCSSSSQSKEKMIQDFRQKIGFDIDKNFKKLNYKRKINKSNVQDILLNNKYTDNNTHIYIGDLLNLNITVIYGTQEYGLLNNYSNDRHNILLYYDRGVYCPLLNQENNNFLEKNTINQIKKMYSQKTIFDIKKHNQNKPKKSSINELIQNNNIEIFGGKKKLNTEDIFVQVEKDNTKVFVKKEDIELLKMQDEKNNDLKIIKGKIKLDELQKIAKKYNIDIYNGTKKKLKKDLLSEIINYLS